MTVYTKKTINNNRFYFLADKGSNIIRVSSFDGANTYKTSITIDSIDDLELWILCEFSA